MRVIVLYSEDNKNTLDKYSGIFEELSIEIKRLEVTETWEYQEDFLDTITTNEHFFIIASLETIQEKWFKFVVGYCLTKKYSLYISLSDRGEYKLPEYFKRIDYGYDNNCIKKFYEELIKTSTKKQNIDIAVDKIKKLGLYLTPHHFFYCIERDDIEAVKLFLEAGISPDSQNENGVPAFNFAVRLKYNNLAQLLVENNCDINKVSVDKGNNALMEAAAEGNKEMAAFLIEKGLDIETQSKNDQTALMLAVGRNDIEIVEMLLDAGADTDKKDVLDMTAIRYAEILKYKDILKLFKKFKKGV